MRVFDAKTSSRNGSLETLVGRSMVVLEKERKNRLRNSKGKHSFSDRSQNNHEGKA